MSIHPALFTLLALAFSLPTIATPDCLQIEDSFERRECFESNLATAQGLMQNELDAAKTRLEDLFRDEDSEKTEALTRLLAAQGSWTQYSQQECSVQSLGALHGGGEASRQLRCMVELTNKRTKELKTVGKLDFEY